MRNWMALALAGLCLGGVLWAEPLSPQSPAPPPGPMAAPQDGPHYMGRGFERRMDDTARILPPGPWWKDQDLVKRLELTPDQQKRIEDTFLQSKISLIRMHASLHEEELLLQPMLDANPIDQGRALAQISKIADLRAELEKANARMLLQVRGVLNQQQWTRLQQERPSGMHQHRFLHGPEGPRSRMEPMPDGVVRAEP